jgi:hypothetical protein
MSRLTVERAQPADAAAAERLLDGAAWLQSRGIDQWKPGQFGEEVRQSIASGELFAARRGAALVGCFLLEAEEPQASLAGWSTIGAPRLAARSWGGSRSRGMSPAAAWASSC